ncbi:MAG: alpha-amylase family glycosyl hydrolase, partial [Anaerolineales bacterium]
LTNVFPEGFRDGHYLPLGSHDTERILTLCDQDTRKVRLAALVSLTFPGAPAVYYGDEIGLEGGKDPDSRRAFPWDESRWDRGLREHFKALIRARRNAPELRRGEVVPLLADDSVRVCAYGRRWKDRTAAVALNASDAAQRVEIPLAPLGWRDGLEVVDSLGGKRFGVRNGRIEIRLPAFEGVLLLPPA